MTKKLANAPRLSLVDTAFLPFSGEGQAPEARHKVRLFVAEEQEVLRNAYETLLAQHTGIEVIGVSGTVSGPSLAQAIGELRPEAALVGVKVLRPAIVHELEAVREAYPGTAIVLLSATYEVQGLHALREFARGTPGGCAYLLKHTVDTVSQLAQVVQTAAEGRVILDPAVMDGLIAASGPQTKQLKKLSPRELEVLGLMAQGYRNNAIADILGLDPKTVDRHINGIYAKLGEGPGTMHPRVRAVMLYMRATGQLLHDVPEA
jgi:DNA-binding NarL/FixJ family response regulator